MISCALTAFRTKTTKKKIKISIITYSDAEWCVPGTSSHRRRGRPNTKNAARQREGCARTRPGPAHDIRGSHINRAAQGRQTRNGGDVTRGEVRPPRGSVGTSAGVPGLDLARKLGSVQLTLLFRGKKRVGVYILPIMDDRKI